MSLMTPLFLEGALDWLAIQRGLARRPGLDEHFLEVLDELNRLNVELPDDLKVGGSPTLTRGTSGMRSDLWTS
jgi:hypothetical protein